MMIRGLATKKQEDHRAAEHDKNSSSSMQLLSSPQPQLRSLEKESLDQKHMQKL